MKSETYFSREPIGNQCGKVLRENSIIGRSWSSVKLFFMLDYTDNAKCAVFLVSLSSNCAHVPLGRKAKLINRFLIKIKIFFIKIFLFYDDNANQLC